VAWRDATIWTNQPFGGTRRCAERRWPPDALTFDNKHRRLTAEVDRTPGVLHSATVSWIPFTGYTTFGFDIEGRPPAAGADRPWARMQAVAHGYFAVMRIPIVRGRAFNAKDVDGAPRVAIISESMARRQFVEKGGDAVGRALILEGKRYEIVGVSRDVYHYGANRGGLWEVYWPQPQWPTSRVALVVRTDGDPAAASAAVTRVVRAFDRDLAISRVAAMQAVADEYLKRYRVMAAIMVAFAVIALAISAIGLYGVEPVDPLVLAAATLTLGVLAVAASFVPARRAARVDPMTSLRAE
jgi:putative ABC transport system permease protein